MSGTTEKAYPMVLVFYLDREMMKNQELTQLFAESVNDLINVKNFNAIAFFLPTDGKERIECINPLIVPKEKMEQINKMIEDISKNFGIGEEIKITEVESVIPQTVISKYKINWNYNGWRKHTSDTSPDTQKDWNQTILTIINQVSANIHQSNLINGGNQIIINERMLNIIKTLEYFSITDNVLSEKYKVVLDETIGDDKIYVVYANPEIDFSRVGEITVIGYPEDIF